jgi:hypothetical protein
MSDGGNASSAGNGSSAGGVSAGVALAKVLEMPRGKSRAG